MTEHAASPSQGPDARAKRRAPRSTKIARLIKALRLAEAAIEFGELKAAAAYLRIAAALDRFHELAAESPPPSRSTRTASQTLPTEPQSPTSAAAPGQDDSAVVEEAGAVEKAE